MSRNWSAPLPRRWVLVPAAAIWAVTFVQTISVMSWTYLDWYSLSRLPGQALALTGPLAAGCAAYVASRTRDERSPLGSRVTVRAGASTVSRHVLVIGAAWVAAFCLAALPAFVYGSAVADDGWLNLPTMLASIGSLAAFIGLGYVIGTIWTTLLAPLVAVATTAAALVMLAAVPPTYGNAVTTLIPSREAIVGRVGQSLSNGPILVQAGFFIALAVTVFLISAAWPRRSDMHAWVAPVAGGALTAAMATAILAGGLTVIDRGGDVPSHCEEREGVEFCVAVAQTSALDQVITTSDATMAAVGGYPDEIDYIGVGALEGEARDQRDDPVSAAEDPPDHDPSAIIVNVPPTLSTDSSMRPTLIRHLSGAEACNSAWPERSPDADEAWNRTRALSGYLWRMSDGTAPADDAFEVWYQEHASEILACSSPELPEVVEAESAG